MYVPTMIIVSYAHFTTRHINEHLSGCLRLTTFWQITIIYKARIRVYHDTYVYGSALGEPQGVYLRFTHDVAKLRQPSRTGV